MKEQTKQQKLQVKETLQGLTSLAVVCADIAAAYVLYFSIHQHIATTVVAVVLVADASYRAAKFIMVVK